MVDFLKQFPFVSINDYKWELSVPMIKIMTSDNSRVNYLSDEQADMRTARKIDMLNTKNDLGIPLLK